MPKRVEDVRFRIERVLLASLISGSKYDGSVFCRVGVGGVEGSVEVGVSSKRRRGVGCHSGEESAIFEKSR